MKSLIPLLVSFLLALDVFSQDGRLSHGKTENIILFALDGMRWQEIFGGVDSSLMNDKKFTQESGDMYRAFWDNDPALRRRRLMPFLWDNLARHGQLYGNRALGNYVDVSNPYNITYPGFSEIITGFADTALKSNALQINRNGNVLEAINAFPEFRGKVCTFSTSDLFPYILDRWRNGLFVNSDTDSLPEDSPQMQLLNKMEKLAAKPSGERPDLLTYFAGREYLIQHHPRALYIALGETDAFAHMSSYDQYIGAVHAEDAMMADLWALVQSLPEYRDKTTLLVFCDHGRGGAVKAEWTDHGADIKGSGSIWIAALGPDSSPLGEMSSHAQLYQGQLAATIAALLGIPFTPQHKTLPRIESVLK